MSNGHPAVPLDGEDRPRPALAGRLEEPLPQAVGEVGRRALPDGERRPPFAAAVVC
jgi:hypothetical protein